MQHLRWIEVLERGNVFQKLPIFFKTRYDGDEIGPQQDRNRDRTGPLVLLHRTAQEDAHCQEDDLYDEERQHPEGNKAVEVDAGIVFDDIQQRDAPGNQKQGNAVDECCQGFCSDEAAASNWQGECKFDGLVSLLFRDDVASPNRRCD